MRRTLTSLADRMLAKLVPGATAVAASCPGRYIGRIGSCYYWCYQSGGHSMQYKYCDARPRCVIDCNDCC
jgi:hypothetical protein